MKNILVVDDCDEIREILFELLTDAGYEVSSSGNPEEGLKMCASKSFDLVLCDLVMPLGDEEGGEFSDQSAMVGVNAISKFNQLTPKIPIIAISGELTGPALQHMKQFGAINAISKPFNRDELLQKIECAFDERLSH